LSTTLPCSPEIPFPEAGKGSSGTAIMKMRNTRDSGKPDLARTEPYIFRGAR
jgi:hypothetical protein